MSNPASRDSLLGWIQVDVDLKGCDAMGVDPCDSDELKLIGAGVYDFQVNDTVRPPPTKFFWAITKTVANIKFDQASNLLVEHRHGLRIGIRTDLPGSKAFQKPCLYQGAVCALSRVLNSAIRSSESTPCLTITPSSMSKNHGTISMTRSFCCCSASIPLGNSSSNSTEPT